MAALYWALNSVASSFRSSAVSSTSCLTPAGFLHLVDELLEVGLADLHDHVGVHLDEPTVGVVGEARVAGLGSEGLDDGVVHAQVEDRVHHARHGGAGAGADRDQQRVGRIAELLAGDRLELGDVGEDLGLDRVVDDLAIDVVLGTGLGGDAEALRDGHSEPRHLGQVRTLAAEQVPHRRVTLAEFINELVVGHREVESPSMGSGSGRLGLDQHRHRPGPVASVELPNTSAHTLPTVSGSSTQIIPRPCWLTGWTGRIQRQRNPGARR